MSPRPLAPAKARFNRWYALVGAVAFAPLFASCGLGPEATPQPLPTFDNSVVIQSGGPDNAEETPSTGSYLEDARRAGADPTQLRILEKGEVSFADYEAAVGRALNCMRKAGIDVLGPDLSEETGLKLLHYSWSDTVPGLTQKQAMALGDDCLTRYCDFVDTVWQTQPSSIEAEERYFDRFRAAVVACIRTNGGTVRDDPTRAEAVRASIPVQDRTGIDCFETSGISQ